VALIGGGIIGGVGIDQMIEKFFETGNFG